MKRSEFVNEIEKEYANHSVYIGTGNGEMLYDLTVADIIRMEKNYGDKPPKRVNQVMTFIGKQVEAGVDLSKARAEDCSGMIVGALRRLGLIPKTADYAARMFQADKTKPIALKDLVAGDLVYDKKSAATHVGVYVGNDMVIESKGRSYGVVKRKLSAGPWVIGGRFDWWEDDVFTFHRNLKYVAGNQMKGEDVSMLQKRLNELKVTTIALAVDGSFGKKTDEAVRAYQKANGLVVDGIVGRSTVKALGFLYE